MKQGERGKQLAITIATDDDGSYIVDVNHHLPHPSNRTTLISPSVTRLIHSKCMAVSGSGNPARVEKNIAQISPMLQLIKKHMNACMLA
jgi:hypothetical protein